MKKIIKLLCSFVLFLVLSFMFLNLRMMANEEGTSNDYYEEIVFLKYLDFNSLVPDQTYTTNQIPDMYTGNTFTAIEDGIDGTSIKYVASGESELELFSLDGTGNDSFRAPGKYHFSADFKSNNAKDIIIWVVRNYDEISGGKDGLIAEYRRKLAYTDGVLTSCTNDDINGWRTIWSPDLIVRPGYENDTTEIKDGVIHIGFDYEIKEDAQWGTQWNPTFAFKANTTKDSLYIFDNIQITKIGEDKKYFTYDWNYDFEGAEEISNIHDVQPVWSNVGGVESETPLDGKYSYRIEHTTTSSTEVWGDVVGGFDSLSENKKFIRHIGLNYIQMDIDIQGFQWANIWTLGDDYYAIKYETGIGWVTEGKVMNFKSVDLGNCFRISYYVNYTNINTEHSINAYNGSGTIMIDNLVVAYEDYSPYIENGTYNLINPEDVILNCSLKNGTFTSLDYKGGSSLETSLYSIEDSKLTISSEVFEGREAFTFILKTTKGEKEFTISMNDNRTLIESISSSEISKIYDGTNTVDMSNVVLSLQGVEEGDEVNLVANYAFASTDACEDIEINLTNISLEGKDANKYKLKESYSLTGEIKPKQLLVENLDVVKEKVYDSTNTCTINDYKVSGILEGEDVLVKAEAKFNDSHVSTANEITVHYTLSGEKASNYIAPIDDCIDENVSITPKTVTVTANNQACVLGEEVPTLTYDVDGLLNDDTLSGSLTVNNATEVGEFDILVGTLDCSSDYELNFVGAKLTISAASVKKGCGSSPTELISILMSFIIIIGTVVFMRTRKGY